MSIYVDKFPVPYKKTIAMRLFDLLAWPDLPALLRKALQVGSFQTFDWSKIGALEVCLGGIRRLLSVLEY